MRHTRNKKMYDRNKFKTSYDIDNIAHPDDQLVKICGKDVPLGNIRRLHEAFEEKRYNMISFYDDMFQYTSLGLLDLLFDIYKINSPIPVKQFFHRKSIYGINFVYDIAQRFNITKGEVDEIKKNNYEEILSRSPLAHNALSYYKMREICSNHLLVMAYPINIAASFTRFIQEEFGKDEFISLELDYIYNKTEEEYLSSLPKTKLSYFDIVICQDAASTLEFITNNDIKDTQILTPFEHCGLSEEAKFTFEVCLEGTGPNNTKIYYIAEEA
jgi:hypothetical protein